MIRSAEAQGIFDATDATAGSHEKILRTQPTTSFMYSPFESRGECATKTSRYLDSLDLDQNCKTPR